MVVAETKQGGKNGGGGGGGGGEEADREAVGYGTPMRVPPKHEI